ncbi:MAG: GntR family transcriptional regulator [Gammaproteobacteria bacterium]|nr:GntR family transcriptional regulator [Gammaproteobacteria bacterium]
MEFDQTQAIYLQIADLICEKILLKQYESNSRIPAVRELAVEIAVNPNTVARSYSYLEEQGIIYKQRGIGYFIADNGYQKTLMLKKNNFIKNELPKLTKQLELFNIDLNELSKLMRGKV